MNEHKVNIPMRLAGILLCLVLISMHFTSGLYARYTTSSSSEDSARVAKYVFNVAAFDGASLVTSLDVSDMYPGDKRIYTLVLTNFDLSSNVCEVATEYEFVLDTTGHLPLEYTVEYQGSDSKGCVKVTDKMKWSGGTMEASEKITHIYILTVNWPGIYNSDFYNDEIDMVTLTLNNSQID